MANSNGWGDGASNNDIGWGQGADNAIGWGSIYANSWAGATDIVGTPAVDPDAQAFITAASITDPTQQSAINTLVTDLKGYSIWSKMKALYPFVGGTASAHKFNLKDPRDLDAAFRLVFNGGWTHSSTGATPNGTNGYADTFFVPSTHLGVNSNSLGYYSGTNLSETSSDPVNMGTFDSGTQAMALLKSNTTLGSRLNGSIISYSTATMRGFFSASRQSATLTDVYLNGSQVSTGNSGGTLPTNKCFIGTSSIGSGAYASGYVKNDFRFAYLSDGLTDAEISNLYTAVQSYQTTLGRQVGTPIPLTGTLLNDYPDAAAAYSLRKLSTTYTGDAIRVRRSSDNTEQNIGFVNNVLDTASLLTFCGAGNGFVTTWYDQSGNANNATQSTAANQPQIVSSGAMITTNGKNSISFDGNNDFLETTGTPFSATENTLIAVSKQDATGSYKRLFNIGNYTNGRFLGSANGTDDMLAVFNNATLTCSGGVAITQNLSIMYNAGTNGVLRNNGSQVNTTTANNNSYGNQNLFIGNDSLNYSGYFWNGIGQEFIFYPSSQSANVAGIESNINTFYTIY